MCIFKYFYSLLFSSFHLSLNLWKQLVLDIFFFFSSYQFYRFIRIPMSFCCLLCLGPLWNVKTHDTLIYHTELIFLLGHSINASLPLILWEYYLHYDVLYGFRTKLQILCQKYYLCKLFYNLIILDQCIVSTDNQPRRVRTDDKHNAQLSASHATSLKGLNYHTIMELKIHTSKMVICNLSHLLESMNVTGLYDYCYWIIWTKLN